MVGASVSGFDGGDVDVNYLRVVPFGGKCRFSAYRDGLAVVQDRMYLGTSTSDCW